MHTSADVNADCVSVIRNVSEHTLKRTVQSTIIFRGRHLHGEAGERERGREGERERGREGERESGCALEL